MSFITIQEIKKYNSLTTQMVAMVGTNTWNTLYTGNENAFSVSEQIRKLLTNKITVHDMCLQNIRKCITTTLMVGWINWDYPKIY